MGPYRVTEAEKRIPTGSPDHRALWLRLRQLLCSGMRADAGMSPRPVWNQIRTSSSKPRAPAGSVVRLSQSLVQGEDALSRLAGLDAFRSKRRGQDLVAVVQDRLGLLASDLAADDQKKAARYQGHVAICCARQALSPWGRSTPLLFLPYEPSRVPFSETTR